MLQTKKAIQANPTTTSTPTNATTVNVVSPPPANTPQTKNTEIWKPVKPRTATQKTNPDRACWLYIYNHVTRDRQIRVYKGDKE